MCKSSAQNAAASPARATAAEPGHAAARNVLSRRPKSSASEAATSARYAARPTIPCSAATVSAIVCEAAATFSELTSSRSRKRSAKDPAPNPSTGRSRTIDSPPPTRSERPLVARSRLRVSRLSMPGASRTSPSATAAATPAAVSTGHGFQRSAASTARPSSSAAKLDCESENTSPTQSTISAPAISSASFRRRVHSSTAASRIIVSAR